jgi:Tfp pilus assembly protein PilV
MTVRSHRFARHRAFTLFEVMVAMLIFFLAIFTILELVSMGLTNARRLQRPTVNTTAVAAWWSVTNRLRDGNYSGDFRDLLGDKYDNFTWEAQVLEITNGLFRVDLGIVERTVKGASASKMSMLLYQPGGTAGVRR